MVTAIDTDLLFSHTAPRRRSFFENAAKREGFVQDLPAIVPETVARGGAAFGGGGSGFGSTIDPPARGITVGCGGGNFCPQRPEYPGTDGDIAGEDHSASGFTAAQLPPTP